MASVRARPPSRNPPKVPELRRLLLGLFVLALLGTSCTEPRLGAALPPQGARVQKVIVIGVPAITWDDLNAVDSPFLRRLISQSAIANVSVRVTNEPADAYATLGAGERTETDPSHGWSFNSDEAVENGTGRDLWERRRGSSGTQSSETGDVYLPTIGGLNDGNRGRAFNALPGLLGSVIARNGGKTAVIGNADLSLGALPSLLPSIEAMQSANPPETGIHRESALAAMTSSGIVAEGSVSRSLLERDPSAPFGTSTDESALLSAFRDAMKEATLIVVETGDTARIDSYTQGLNDEDRKSARRQMLTVVAENQIRPLVQEIGSNNLVLIVAPTTPGGSEERGQLRPAIVTGAGVPSGIATSRSTGRPGIITLPDLTATIAASLELNNESLNSLHRMRVISRPSDALPLVRQNERAIVHDAIRGPMSAAIILLHLALYVLVVYRLRQGPLQSWLGFLLLVGMAFPIASFITTFGAWRLGVGMAATAIALGALAIAGVAHVAERRKVGLGAASILGLTCVFLFLDLGLGAPAQLDSVLGYTSVASGRFYGLGNLGFALFTSSAFLTAAILGDAARAGGRSKILLRAIPAAFLALFLVWVGHPRLGNDVGGVLTIVPGIFVFGWTYLGKGRLKLRHFLLVGLATLVILGGFGLIDLLRPAGERTHLGRFLSDLYQDPATLWLFARRKLGLAIALTFAARWGLAVPGAIAVLIWLYRRARGTFKEMLIGRDALRAGLQAVFVAAIVGSLVNDSGLAVAGMMLAVATPWALLRASASEAREAA